MSWSLAVTRAKNGTPATHPLAGRELRALRRLHREAEGKSPFLFVSERGSPMTVSNFQKLIDRATEAAGLKIKAHPHMLRHACGFALANAGKDTRALQAYLGHKNIQHTVRYTELSGHRRHLKCGERELRRGVRRFLYAATLCLALLPNPSPGCSAWSPMRWW